MVEDTAPIRICIRASTGKWQVSKMRTGRIQKAFTQNSTTTTTNYLYDGSNAVADIDQNGNVLARYAETQNKRTARGAKVRINQLLRSGEARISHIVN